MLLYSFACTCRCSVNLIFFCYMYFSAILCLFDLRYDFRFFDSFFRIQGASPALLKKTSAVSRFIAPALHAPWQRSPNTMRSTCPHTHFPEHGKRNSIEYCQNSPPSGFNSFACCKGLRLFSLAPGYLGIQVNHSDYVAIINPHLILLGWILHSEILSMIDSKS
jgi:hypothetical protein